MQRCMQAKPVTFMGRQVKDEEGNNLWKFDSQGANKALDMLMKHTGGYNADNQQKQALMTSVQKIFVTPDEVEEVDKHIKETINNDKQ